MTNASSGAVHGPLDGVRVVDLTDERAIYGAKLLADLGADVVRPETAGGDALRARGPMLETVPDDTAGASLYFAFFASSRRHVPAPDDPAALQALIAGADVLLTQDGSGWTEALNRDALLAANPGLVWIDTTSLGRDGPWKDYQAPDLIAGALAGAAAATGDVDTDPLKPFGEINFMVPGAYVAIAALAGLYAREGRGGHGTSAHVSAHESIASCLEQVLMFYWYADVMQRSEEQVLPRRGALHWSNAFTVMNGVNGSIMITPTPDFDKQLAWLVEEDAHDDLFDEQYQDPENLALLIGRTMQLLAQWVAGKDVEALFFDAQARHIPYGWVQPIERVPDNPQLVARNWFASYAVAGEAVQGPGAPYQFSRTPWQLRPPADDVLEALDWTPRPAPSGSAPQGSDRPLEGLRVLDFTHVLAGPFATRVLGDMGADVVKVNSESRATTSNAPEHPYYIMWNRNKRALALDMASDEGRALGRRLAEAADVVIDNFSVGVLDRWGLGYDAVREVNAGVIYVQMSGMGDGGPWSEYVTYAPTIHALSGLTSLTGVPGRTDIGLGYSYNDHQSGLHGAVAVLAALCERQRSGAGQRIDISQFEVGVNFAGPALLDLFGNGRAAHAMGNKLPYDLAVPHNVYRCAPADAPTTAAERWLAIACMTDEHWQNLCEAMGNPAWCRDAELATAAGRAAREQDIDAALSAWTATQDDYELMAILQAAGVPAGVVQNGVDLAERDPQLSLGGFLAPIDEVHPDIGQTYAERLPVQFDDMPCDRYVRVRALGEDNAAVLADWLGLSPQAIDALGDVLK